MDGLRDVLAMMAATAITIKFPSDAENVLKQDVIYDCMDLMVDEWMAKHADVLLRKEQDG